MLDETIYQRLHDLVAPMAEAMGLTLWGIEYAGGQGRPALRIYLDSEDGVTIDQCARLSRDMSVVLDVEDIVPGAYNLEVSSPGLERPFFSTEQMAPYVGRKVQVHLHEPRDYRRKFSGTLKSVEGDAIAVEEDDGVATIDWNDVKRAHLRYEFPSKGKKA